MNKFLALLFVCVNLAFSADVANGKMVYNNKGSESSAKAQSKKIAILSANGKAGSLIVKEALGRGIDVNAFVRKSSTRVPKGAKIIKKDIFALKANDLKDFDIVISAFGAEDSKTFERYYNKLAELFSNLTSTKLIVVGGAGSLYMDKARTLMLKDTPDFPEAYKAVANAHAEGLNFLRGLDFDWTYVSPPAAFVYDAPRSGKYTLGGEEFFTNHKGESKGSYADYAIAVIDLAINGGYKKQRVSVVGE